MTTGGDWSSLLVTVGDQGNSEQQCLRVEGDLRTLEGELNELDRFEAYMSRREGLLTKIFTNNSAIDIYNQDLDRFGLSPVVPYSIDQHSILPPSTSIIDQRSQLNTLSLIVEETAELREEMQTLRDKAILKLEENAKTDPLTNLFNRRAFAYSLGRRIGRMVHNKNYNLAILLLDIDNFKSINDEKGHLFGDRVIEAVGTAIVRTIRPDDLASRFGGDEFSIALFCNVQYAEIATRRVQKAVYDKAGVECTIGIALADHTIFGEEDSVKVLHNQADLAMYKGKSNGKNKIVRYSAFLHKNYR